MWLCKLAFVLNLIKIFIIMNTTALFKHNYNSTAHVVVNQGGTSSGKTYAIEQVLFTLAVEEKLIITIVGQDIPNLKSGAMRDAAAIHTSSKALQYAIKSFNKTDRIYEFINRQH
jgi:phage terminase large subunit